VAVVAMMAVVVMTVVPAMPAKMAVGPPMRFRCLGPGILLDGRRGAGIAERQRIGALGRRDESEQCANGRKPQNLL
jgi:hypothetical protein